MAEIKQHFYTKAEQFLVNMELLMDEVKQKKEKLQLIAEEDGIAAINWDKVGYSTAISDLTGNTAIRNIDEAGTLLEDIKRLDRKIQKVKDKIEELPETEKRVIVLFYVDKVRSVAAIAKEIGFSESHAQRFRRRGVESIAKALFGLTCIRDTSFMDINV